MTRIADLIELFDLRGTDQYGGEAVSQVSHADNGGSKSGEKGPERELWDHIEGTLQTSGAKSQDLLAQTPRGENRGPHV